MTALWLLGIPLLYLLGYLAGLRRGYRETEGDRKKIAECLRVCESSKARIDGASAEITRLWKQVRGRLAEAEEFLVRARKENR